MPMASSHAGLAAPTLPARRATSAALCRAFPRPLSALPRRTALSPPLQTSPFTSRLARRSTTPQAAAAAAAVASPTNLFLGRVTTGVPFVEAFRSMPLADAGMHAFALVGLTTMAVLFGNSLVEFIGAKLSAALDPEHGPRGAISELVSYLIRAAERPTCVMFPWFGASFATAVVAAFAEVAVERWGLKNEVAGAAASQVVEYFKHVAQLMQDAYEVVLIVFV